MHLTSLASFHRRSEPDQTDQASLISCGVCASDLTCSQPRACPNSSSLPTYQVGVLSEAKQNQSMWFVLLSFLYAGRPCSVPPVRVNSPSLSCVWGRGARRGGWAGPADGRVGREGEVVTVVVVGEAVQARLRARGAARGPRREGGP